MKLGATKALIRLGRACTSMQSYQCLFGHSLECKIVIFREAQWLSWQSVRLGIEGLLVQDSPEILNIVFLAIHFISA